MSFLQRPRLRCFASRHIWQAREHLTFGRP